MKTLHKSYLYSEKVLNFIHQYYANNSEKQSHNNDENTATAVDSLFNWGCALFSKKQRKKVSSAKEDHWVNLPYETCGMRRKVFLATSELRASKMGEALGASMCF